MSGSYYWQYLFIRVVSMMFSDNETRVSCVMAGFEALAGFDGWAKKVSRALSDVVAAR